MKKIVILLWSILLISGCQQEEQQQEETLEQESTSFYEQNVAPPPVTLAIGEKGVTLRLVSYCWNEDLQQCPATLSEPPEAAIFDGVSAMRVKPKEEGHINAIGEQGTVGNGNQKRQLLIPSMLELFQIEDGQYTPIPVEEGAFFFPQEEGRYTFVIKVTYDAEAKGIAFYAFQAIVNNS